MRTYCNKLLCAALLIVGLAGCAKENTESGKGSSGGEINKQVDAYMQARYLWNGEYKQMQRNFSLSYDQFLIQTLLGMQTNTLDKKAVSGGYTLYSHIDRKSPVTKAMGGSRGVNHSVKKEAVSNYGIANMTAITYVDKDDRPTGKYALAVSGVFADSPASKAGIKRGALFDQVNGQALSKANINAIYKSIVSPSGAATCKLSGGEQTYTLTAEQMYTDPVLYSDVIEEGAHRIGYLVYESFDAGYDDQVLDVIREFRMAGVNDVILDLRLNGGGHVISAQMISSCIAGAQCEGKVFEYYRYNDTRMADPSKTSRETGNDYDPVERKFYTNFIYGNYYGVDLKQYALNLRRLYVITSGNTASASELVINSLRGIDIPVLLIGAKTNGKNVGMESKELKDKNYNYELVPITFQSYNAKALTVEPTGLAVNYEVKDWTGSYGDFGQKTEPSLAKALNLITGKAVAAPASRASDAVQAQIADDVVLPATPRRVQGMIQLPPTE